MFGIAAATYPRWRQLHDPAQVDDARRVRALQAEVDRRKRLVAAWMLDKPMLQDSAPKSGDRHPAAGRGRLPGRALRRLAAAGQPAPGRSRSTLRYRPKPRPGAAALVRAIRRLEGVQR